MSEAPKVIWATMENRQQWHHEKPKGEVMSYYSHKYHHDDTVTALQAENARLREVLEKIAAGKMQEDGCYYTNRRSILAARQALKETSNDQD